MVGGALKILVVAVLRVALELSLVMVQSVVLKLLVVVELRGLLRSCTAIVLVVNRPRGHSKFG